MRSIKHQNKNLLKLNFGNTNHEMKYEATVKNKIAILHGRSAGRRFKCHYFMLHGNISNTIDGKLVQTFLYLYGTPVLLMVWTEGNHIDRVDRDDRGDGDGRAG